MRSFKNKWSDVSVFSPLLLKNDFSYSEMWKLIVIELVTCTNTSTNKYKTLKV